MEPGLIEAGDAFHPAWCAWRVARRRGIALAAFYHSNLPQILGRVFGRSGAEPAMRRYVRWLYERFDVVFAPSRLMCAYLKELGVAHAVHQPLGVDASVFAPERRGLPLRERLGLPHDTRVLLYAGRFAQEKNLPVPLQAFARLGRPYHLLLIGGQRTARPAANVTMLPYRRDSLELAGWIASADALVHAGTKETFGLVILEAMACGRPVVAARAGAFPELIDESVGMLAEPQMRRAWPTPSRHSTRATWRHSATPRARGCCASSPGSARSRRRWPPMPRSPPGSAARCRRRRSAAALPEFLNARPQVPAQRVISSTPPNSSAAPSTRSTVSGWCGKPSQPK